jgi:hypothetical protein
VLHDEQNFKLAVDRLNIDTAPRPRHRDALRRQMLQAFEQADTPPASHALRLPARLWRLAMYRRIGRVSVAAAVAVAVFAGFGLWRTQQGIAYAQVVQAVQALQGAIFTQTVNGSDIEPGATRIMILGQRMRQESPDGSIAVVDFQEGKVLSLVPAQKEACLITTDGLPPQTRTAPQDWLRFLKECLINAASEAESLGQRKVSNRPAWGFRIRTSNQTIEVWADPQTSLPVRVEIHNPVEQSTTILADFDFATPPEESLLAMTPPAAYTLTQIGVNAQDCREQDLLDLLRTYAQANDDTFPAKIQMSSGEIGAMFEALGRSKGMAYAFSLTGSVTRGITFLHTARNLRYIGAGAKLGETSRPILWYRLPGSAAYRVIYGDLSVREMPRDKLPASTGRN